MIPRYRIRKAVRGWRWECRDCHPHNGRLIGGLNKNDKWIAWYSPQVTKHPWERCVAAVKLHEWRYHRSDLPS